MQENIFDAPIPGQSLTDTPKNAAWEHPPQFSDVNDAAEYIWDKLHEDSVLTQVVTFLRNDIPIEAITRMVLFGGFTEGKWTPDVAFLLAEIVFKQIMSIGMKAGISKMKLFIGDQSQNKFLKSFSKFKIEKQKADESTVDKSKMKKFVRDVKKELKTNGLMSKGTE